MTNPFTETALRRLGRSLLALGALALLPLLSWGQTQIFNETFGTPGASGTTTTIAAYSTGTAPATFSTKGMGYTYGQGGAANPADIRINGSSSTGYTGASGGGHAYFSGSSGEYGFAISGINASSYTGLTLSLGLRKEAAAGTAYLFTVDYSIDGGTTYTALTLTGAPTTSSAAGWYLISGISVPPAAQVSNLILRFRKPSGTSALRLDDIILSGTAASGTASLAITPTAAFTTFNTPQGTASAAQTYNLTGSNLTADVTVTAPSGFEIAQSAGSSTTTPGGYSSSFTVLQADATAGRTIYVRLTGTTAGTYSGNVTNATTGVTTQNVAVSGNTGSIAVTPATLTAFSTVQGTASAYQTYSLTGTGLASAVTVTAPSGYEVAQSAGTTTTSPGTFAATQSVTATTAAAGRTIYVRLAAATTAGSYGGNVTNAASNAVTQNVAVSGTVSPVPTLTVTPNSLGGFATPQGTPSTAQSYVVSGTNVTAAVTVTAPTGYEVSLDNSSFAATASAPAAAVNASGVTLYVRLTGATAGTPSGNVANATTGATTVNVAVSGSVAGLTVTPASLAAFNAPAGAASAARTYVLTGAGLSGDITVTAPTSFEVSLTGAAGSYAGTQTATQANVQATGGQTVYVRLAANAAGSYSGNVSNSGGGAATQNVAVSGTSVAQPAATPAPTVTAGSLTTTSVVLTLGAGAGTNLLVVVRPSTNAATAPVNGTAYTGNTTYGSGSALGSGFVVFAAANATSVTVTGLSPASGYAADVYTYNVGTAAGGENYGTASSTTNFTTVTPPPSPAGLLLLEEDFDYATGTALVANTATTGWQRITANGSNFPVTTVSGNQTRFTYPQGANFATVKPTGFTESSQASMTGGTNAEDIYKNFGAQPSGTTTLYAAALVNLSSVTGTGAEYFLAFNNSGTTAVGRVFAQAATGGYQLGVTANNGTAVAGNFSNTVMSFNQTYLVVLKVDNSSGTDQASIFIFDNSTTTTLPLAEPTTPSAGPVASGSSSSQLGLMTSVFLRQASGNYPNLSIDNIRVASGWGSAIGFPVFTSATATVGAGTYYGLRVSGTSARATTNGTVALEKTLDLDGGVLATTAANPVRLRYRTPTTPPDDFQILTSSGGTSYVDGPVVREVAANAGPSISFPIGRNGKPRPFTLNIDNAPTVATLYTASQTEGQPADQMLNSPLVRISRVRYYTLTPSPVPPSTGTGAFSGSVELSFGSDDGVTDPGASTFVVAKNSNQGAGWFSIDRQSNTASTLKSGNFQSFSDFILANTDPAVAANPLPVELTAFTAGRAAKGVALAWTTASEKNSAFFEVERSLDGHSFVAVARVQAAGSSAQARTYRNLDADAPAAQLYYRLRVVDQDGTFAYSPTVTVAAGPAGELTLAPNPAHDQLSLLTEQASAYVVRNTLGQVVLSGTTAAGTATTLDVSQLASGVYFFELPGAGRTVRRFAKE